MTDRIPCKNPTCTSTILPQTAVRTGGYCMPCVQAQKSVNTMNILEITKKS